VGLGQLMSTTFFVDPYLKDLQQRMINLSEEFPAERGKGYCNSEGIQVIRDYMRELRSRASKDDVVIPE
jgi:hypothetical protein